MGTPGGPPGAGRTRQASAGDGGVPTDGAGRVPSWSTHAQREQTRARILDVALELIADQGFAATSTREISERLGFTKAALYYHFRTKDDLLAAIVAPVLGELATLVEHAGTATGADVSARRALVEGYVDIVARHAHLIRVVADDPSTRKSGALLAARPLFERLVPLLAGSEAPDVAARTRVVAALGAVHSALVHARPDDDSEVVRTTALEAACGALAIAPAPTRAAR